MRGVVVESSVCWLCPIQCHYRLAVHAVKYISLMYYGVGLSNPRYGALELARYHLGILNDNDVSIGGFRSIQCNYWLAVYSEDDVSLLNQGARLSNVCDRSLKLARDCAGLFIDSDASIGGLIAIEEEHVLAVYTVENVALPKNAPGADEGCDCPKELARYCYELSTDCDVTEGWGITV